MAVRILHCGKNKENYSICLKEKVFGFRNNGPNKDDEIYLVLKKDKITYCGARAVLSEITDYKPWPDSDSYSKSFTIKKLEYCKPFDIKVLSEVGGEYWALKYLQGSKEIKESEAISLLENEFIFSDSEELINLSEEIIDTDDEENQELVDDLQEANLDEVLQQSPDSKLDIMGTFQTIHFKNETDQLRGLEKIVTDNFFQLFPSYPIERTLLISENRMFQTSGFQSSTSENIKGIKGIPDGLLITFNPDFPSKIQIGLIEYECFGEKKTRSTEKSSYLNSHIIPQLMRFASSFSVVTDKQTRDEIINSWTDKIINYIYSDNIIQDKLNQWIKSLYNDISEQLFALKMKEIFIDAFKTNLKVVLIIDDLSSEQKETIKNVINSFKLENGKSIQFTGYVVRLTQRINTINHNSEYALSIQ